MFYYEQNDHFGRWHPRTSVEAPKEGPATNGKRAIRCVREVGHLHDEKTLPELQALYGTKPEPDMEVA